MIGFPSVSMRHDDCYAIDLLASILGDGRPSRLYREVKDKQKLVLDIAATITRRCIKGIFGIMRTAEDSQVDAAREAILKVVFDARTAGPPSADELARAKQQNLHAAHVGQMTVDGLPRISAATGLSPATWTSGPLYRTHAEGDRRGHLRVAKKYFTPEKVNVAIMTFRRKRKAKPRRPKRRRRGISAKDAARLNDELAALQKDHER